MRAAAASSMGATDDLNPASATVVVGVKVPVGLVGDGAGLGAGCDSSDLDVEVVEQPAAASTVSTAARRHHRRRRWWQSIEIESQTSIIKTLRAIRKQRPKPNR